MTLDERHEILSSVIEPGRRIRFSEPLPGEAKAIFHLVDKAGLEGMVSKGRDSKYCSGRSTAWLKAKCYSVDEYELLGVEREAGKPAFALMADRATGRLRLHQFRARDPRTALKARAGACRPAPEGMKRPATQWVGSGIIAA